MKHHSRKLRDCLRTTALNDEVISLKEWVISRMNVNHWPHEAHSFVSLFITVSFVSPNICSFYPQSTPYIWAFLLTLPSYPSISPCVLYFYLFSICKAAALQSETLIETIISPGCTTADMLRPHLDLRSVEYKHVKMHFPQWDAQLSKTQPGM